MKTIAYMLVGAAVAFSGVVLAFIVYKFFVSSRCHGEKTEPLDDLDSEYVGLRIQKRAQVYSFNVVNLISEGFTNHIADGKTYIVFKGTLRNGMEVAIKCLRENLGTVAAEVEKFRLQIDLLYRAQHQHVVNLVGYCDQAPHFMLLCQYVPNSSLFQMLHGGNKTEQLNWRQRLKIAIGIANGLRYLHHSCNPPIIHGKLTSANVLLTQDFAAKISGLGKVSHSHSQSELQNGGQLMSSGEDEQAKQRTAVSQAGDVYSFGVILLELLSGKREHSKETGKLVDWASPFLTKTEETMGLMDSSLQNVHSLEFHCMCNIARQCVQSDSQNRPAMTDVMDMIMNFKFQSSVLMPHSRFVKAPSPRRTSTATPDNEFTPWYETERPLGIDVIRKSKMLSFQERSPQLPVKIDAAFTPRPAVELPPGISAGPYTFTEVRID